MLALLLGATAGWAQDTDDDANGDKTVTIVRIDSEPEIDGLLDEAIWAQATLIEDLHQLNPVEYAQPSQPTEIRLAYDENALYVSARLLDSDADRITAQVLRQGEGLSNEDRFAIILDPYLDRRSGYRFQVNPNGVRWDALYRDTSSVESNWEGIWQGAATQGADGWTAEMAIPFKTLSFNPANDTWGVNFERTIQRNDETLGWVSRNRQLNPGVAGTISGFEGLEQGRGLDIIPSVSVSEQRSYGVTSGSSVDWEPSLDIFYKITPLLNAALTINTDFSATEVDDRQVNLTRFGLFFPEKRDFFLQDADIFEFGRIGGGGGGGRGGSGGGGGGGGGFGGGFGQNGRPFFSRTIGLSRTGQPVDIEYGGKLSGRAGRFNLGALAVRQAEFGDIGETDIFVGRAAANILDESTLGFIVTDGDPHSNLDSSTVGTDFRYRNTRLPGGRVLEGEAWYQQSDTQGIADDDAAYGFGISSPNSTGLRGSFSTRYIEENFDPALGFVNETGIRGYSMEIGYRHRYRESWFRTFSPSVRAFRVERLDTGGLDREDVSVGFEIDNNTGDRMFTRLTTNREIIPADFTIYRPSDGSPTIIIPAGDYSWTRGFMGVRSGEHRPVALFVGGSTGEYFDGESTELRANATWRPSPTFSLDVGYSINDISLPDGDFIVRLSTMTLQYVFSSTLSWVNLIQYDNFSETVGLNSRLHWIPEAGREGFIVFNHSVADPNKNDSFHSTGADVSVKFNYTWRF